MLYIDCSSILKNQKKRKRISGYPGSGRGVREKATKRKETFGVMRTRTLLIVEMVSQLHTQVRTYQTVPLNCVQATQCL